MYPWNRTRPFDPLPLFVDDDGEGPTFSCASCGCSSCRWDLDGGDFARQSLLLHGHEAPRIEPKQRPRA